MRTASDIIAALGGYRSVATATGKPVGTVSAWLTRGAIPPRMWPNLVAIAAEQGVTEISIDLLFRIYSANAAGSSPPSETAP